MAANPRMYGFVFTNNMVSTGKYSLWSTGGGPTSCAYSGTAAEKIARCFSTYTFRNNALIGTPLSFPPLSWPAGNFFPPTTNAAGVALPDDGGGGVDYELKPGSPYKNAGTDGRDLGADIVGLETALAGVE
jgi:hypothetical protein